MPIISVIIPVYFVEKYLERCINSVLAQTFTDFELILVDDGSPDNCGRICDEYAKKDKRIKVIHKENGGVSDARNAALEIVKGRYVTFCDSDDWIEITWLEKLLEKMNTANADMVVGDYKNVDDAGNVINYVNHQVGTFDTSIQKKKVEYIIFNVLSGIHGWEVWDRMFRNDIIQQYNIRFCTSCSNFAEDLGFVLEYMMYCKSVHVVRNCGYCYFQRKDSMMNKSVTEIKLNSMNEISVQFGDRFKQEMYDSKYRKQYPIIHFLIMYNQYFKLIFSPEYCTLPNEIQKIRNQKWYKKETVQIFFCYKQLKEYFGKKRARQILLFSNFCLHGNWKRFGIESAVCYKLLINDD